MDERKVKITYDEIRCFIDNDILISIEKDQLLELLETREQIRKHHDDFLELMNAVKENQLNVEEEQEIKKLLMEKKREENTKNESFASVVEMALEQEIELKNPNEPVKNRFYDVIERCFKNHPIGKMNVSEIMESLVERLIIDAVNTCGKNRSDLEIFLGVLQAGLDEAARKGMLSFTHSEKIYKRYIVIAKSRNYIENIYTQEEIGRIKGWIVEHSGDIAYLALKFWFTTGVSPEEIVQMRISAIRREEENGEMSAIQMPESGIYLILNEERKEIIKAAIALNSSYKRMEYLFSIDLGLKWKKLSVQGMAKKLYHICKELGIEYKGLHHNDVLI